MVFTIKRRNDGGGGGTIPWRRITAGDAGKSQQSHKYFCFRKTSGSNMGSPNLLLAPGAIYPRYTPVYNTRTLPLPPLNGVRTSSQILAGQYLF